MSKQNLGLPPAWDGSVSLHTPEMPMNSAHRHDELELNLVTAGRAAYLLGERRYDLARNTLVWLFPEQDHILLDRSADYQMWIGLFKPSLLGGLGLHAPGGAADRAVLGEAAPAGHFCRRVSEHDGVRLAALLGEVFTRREDTAHFNAGLGYALLSAWCAYRAADEAAAGPDVHPAVDQAARLLRDEPEGLSLDELAERVGLSASYLSRLFHAQTGVTLAAFRNRQRISRFLRLYGSGRTMSALEAALETGFGSYPQFHRVFCEQMGCNLAAYRRTLRRSPP